MKLNRLIIGCPRTEWTVFNSELLFINFNPATDVLQ